MALTPEQIEALKRQGRKAKPFGTTPTAPTFNAPNIGGMTTGRGGARRGAELVLTAPTVAPQPTESFAPTQAPAGMQAPTVQQPFTLPEGVALGSPQANFLTAQSQGQMTPEQLTQAGTLAKSMGTTFDPQTGYSRQPFLDAQGRAPQAPSNAPMGVEATQQRLAEMFGRSTPITLNQGLTGNPEAVMAPDFQGRMRSFDNQAAATQNLTQGQAAYDAASAEREQRLAERPDFGTAVSDRDRRAAMGEGMSDADRRDIAQAQDPRATDSERARGMRIAEEAGVDWRTGQPLKAATSAMDQAELQGQLLQNAKTGAEINKIMSPTKEGLSDFEKEVDKKVVPSYLEWNQGGKARSASNIQKLSSVASDLAEGNVDTRTAIDMLPVAQDWARKVFNPSGADAIDRIRGVAYQSLRETLGAQFTEKEGKNLVETYFNPSLGEDVNAERLGDFAKTLQAAYEAKTEMFSYLEGNKTMSGYSGGNAEDIIRSGLSGSGGANGSPIKGDVNIASSADALLSSGNY